MTEFHFAVMREMIGPEGVALAERWDTELCQNGIGFYGKLNGVIRAVKEIFQVEGMADRLESLPVKNRIYALDLILLGLDARNINTHLDVLECAEWPDFVEIEPHYSNVEDLQRSLEQASDNNNIYESINTQLKDAIESIGTFGRFERGELLILRSVFGDETVTEFLSRASVEFGGRSPMNPGEMIPILKKWDRLKNFPISWAQNLIDSSDESTLALLTN